MQMVTKENKNNIFLFLMSSFIFPCYFTHFSGNKEKIFLTVCVLHGAKMK